MASAHNLLLGRVGRFYERHQAPHEDRPDFNVFSVLRSSSDEVNLHSRFLHALLDYREQRNNKRENLCDFLRNVVGVGDFKPANVTVGREVNSIDLLIANRHQAVVVENKIRAGDQDQQLVGYHQKLISQGYDESAITLVYLTPDGQDPSEQSIGDLRCKTISYRNDLPEWLEGCQRRAFDNPALRESIAQYLQLIRTITGTDYSGTYMKELTNLCLTDDNMVLVHDLSQALIDAKVKLVVDLWSDIDKALTSAIDDLPELDPAWAYVSKAPAVKDYILGKRKSQTGLYYRIADYAWLAVVAQGGLWFGISCYQPDDSKRHHALRDALSEIAGGKTSGDAPWFRYPENYPDFKSFTHDSLRLLMSEDRRSEFAQCISSPMGDLWRQIKAHGLAENPS